MATQASPAAAAAAAPLDEYEALLDAWDEAADPAPFDAYPPWLATATPEAKARLAAAFRGDDPRSVTLSADFPCPRCRLVTPHVYVALDFKKEHWTVCYHDSYEEVPAVGRIVRCAVCDRIWVHHVPFKGVPHSLLDISQLVRVADGDS